MIPINEITILFVDDEPDILNALKRFLKREEYIAEFVNGGKETVERLRQGDIDILVTDIQMPEMNGMEVIAHAKKHYPAIVRMVLSANTDFEQTMNSINTGEIFRYILKPLNPKLFRSIMHDAVEYYRMVRFCEQATTNGTPVPQSVSAENDRSLAPVPEASTIAMGSLTPCDKRQDWKSQMHSELEQQIHQELLRIDLPRRGAKVEVASLTQSTQAMNTVFSECLPTTDDNLDILLGNVRTGQHSSPLLGTGFKNLVLKAIVESIGSNYQSRDCPSTELNTIMTNINRTTLHKLRNLNLSMDMIYTRYQGKSLSYVGCGVINILHYNIKAGSYTIYKGENPPLGLLADADFTTRSLTVAAGDILLLYLHTTPPDDIEPKRQISDARIAEIVCQFSALDTKTPLHELGRELRKNHEHGEQDCRLAGFALKIPCNSGNPDYSAEIGLHNVTSGYQNA